MTKNGSFLLFARSVSVSWLGDLYGMRASADDLLRLLVIKEGEKPILLSTAYERYESKGTFDIPFDSGDTVHLYLFFEDKAKMKHSVDFYQSVVLGKLIEN